MSFPLNTEQRAAVRYLDGPLLVLAGAGSGKTRVITAKIAHLIASGIPAKHIAAITFTNRAAKEMKERVEKMLAAGDAEGLTVCTFHSLGHRIVRAEAKHVGLKPNFSIFDSNDVEQIIADIVKSTDRAEARRAQWQISKWKNALLGPSEAAKAAETDRELVWAKVYAGYAAALAAYQAVDFDDLLVLPVRLFENEQERLALWRDRIRYLLIDEYQDTNAAQYRLIQLLAGVGAGAQAAFTAVGDDDQAIYAWRGASVENLARLRDDYPQLRVIMLEQNYRSSVRILRSANRVIANNPKLFEKKLWSEHGLGDTLTVIAAPDDEGEAELVLRKLQAHKFERRTNYADYAILYRGNHQARIFEQVLRAQNVPYTVSGGTSLFERAEVKDLLSYFRLLTNEDDDPAFIRAITSPKRGVGATTLEKLGGLATARHTSLFGAVYAAGTRATIGDRHVPLVVFCDYINKLRYRAEREPVLRLLEELVCDIGYERYLFDQFDPKQAENRWATVRDFINWLGRKGEADKKTLLELAQTLALISMLDEKGQDADAVRLSTLHAAKGLEFPHVFLVGVEEGLLPHRESIENGQIEEERRLMYVGITRAQLSLTITHCRKRKRARDWLQCEPSRFIAELEQDDVRYSGTAADNPETDKQSGQDRLKSLRAMLSQGGAAPVKAS
ncbi:MAG: UvrD-helicase domain-containing protein [Betaproteobacteria bacterium]